jgi:hypothetical protein
MSKARRELRTTSACNRSASLVCRIAVSAFSTSPNPEITALR